VEKRMKKIDFAVRCGKGVTSGKKKIFGAEGTGNATREPAAERKNEMDAVIALQVKRYLGLPGKTTHQYEGLSGRGDCS